jgi:hypothetical protein
MQSIAITFQGAAKSRPEETWSGWDKAIEAMIDPRRAL